jgi:hypothetical protein
MKKIVMIMAFFLNVFTVPLEAVKKDPSSVAKKALIFAAVAGIGAFYIAQGVEDVSRMEEKGPAIFAAIVVVGTICGGLLWEWYHPESAIKNDYCGGCGGYFYDGEKVIVRGMPCWHNFHLECHRRVKEDFCEHCLTAAKEWERKKIMNKYKQVKNAKGAISVKGKSK